MKRFGQRTATRNSPDFRTSSVTYTYRVTAQSGQVSVMLANITESVDDEVQSVSGDSRYSSVNTAEPTEQPTQQPSSEPSPSASASASASASISASAAASGSAKSGSPSQPAASGSQDRMPKTGGATTALWVLAVLAAGAAAAIAVAGKKVFQGQPSRIHTPTRF